MIIKKQDRKRKMRRKGDEGYHFESGRLYIVDGSGIREEVLVIGLVEDTQSRPR